MDDTTIKRLNDINRQFYQITAREFDATRQRPWPGWAQMLPYIHPPLDSALRVLDAGCGNGRLGVFLAQHFSNNMEYVGIDSNCDLLEAGRNALSDIKYELHLDDLLTANLPSESFDLVALMGVLHHIPGHTQRLNLIRRLSASVAPNGILIFTTWRFYEFERFRQRIVPWPSDLETEANDFLLDWRRGAQALRYCHYVDDQEQATLINASALTRITTYRSDGKSGITNSYAVLRREAEVE